MPGKTSRHGFLTTRLLAIATAWVARLILLLLAYSKSSILEDHFICVRHEDTYEARHTTDIENCPQMPTYRHLFVASDFLIVKEQFETEN